VRLALTFLAVILFALPLCAATHHVGAGESIQAAINDAADGDYISVADGTFAGFNLEGRSYLTISGTGGTIIDRPGPQNGPHNDRVDVIELLNSTGTVIEGIHIAVPPDAPWNNRAFHLGNTDGFVFRDGSMTGSRVGLFGGPIRDLLVQNIWFEGNASGGSASGPTHTIYLNGGVGAPPWPMTNNRIIDCTFRNQNHGQYVAEVIHLQPNHVGNTALEGGEISGCVFIENYHEVVNFYGATDWRFENNIVVESNRSLDRMVDCASTSTSASNLSGDRIVIAYNTFVVPTARGWAFRMRSEGCVAFGNIVLGKTDTFRDEGGVNYADHNLLAVYSSGLASSLFVDYANEDYHLREGSAAIEEGVGIYRGVEAPDADYDGNARPAGTHYDLGAYEYQSAPPVEPSVSFLVVMIKQDGTQDTFTADIISIAMTIFGNKVASGYQYPSPGKMIEWKPYANGWIVEVEEE
jgi:hypothetical protein